MSGVITFPYVRAASNARGMFAGLPSALLEQWLTEALVALHELKIGKKTVSLSYNSGDGQKSVTFARSTTQMLNDHIRDLKLALGKGDERHAMDVSFSG